MHKTDRKTYILAGVMLLVIVLLTCLARMDLDILRREESSGAYVSLGDAGLFMALLLIPAPWAALAAALGAAIADFIVGSAIYAPASLVIKGVMVFLASAFLKKNGGTWAGCLKAVGVSEAAMILLYFVYDWLILGDYSVAALALPYNVLQALACALIAVPVLKLFFGKSYGKEAPFSGTSNASTKRTLK